jgi:hypothetical protein
MSITSPGSTHSLSGANPCIALAYAAGGAALMNAWLSLFHANVIGHVAATIPWLCLALLSALRMPPGTPDDAHANLPAGTGWPIVLPLAGGAVGLLVAAGSSLLLGVVAIGCSFAPWQRIRLCRQRPILASLVMCAGGAAVLVLCRHAVDVMFLPVAAWILGMSGLVALLGTPRKARPAQRPAQADSVPARP